eukprot:SAG22_NODE_4782_length_1165_cov_1.549719_1_plen_179_part_01
MQPDPMFDSIDDNSFSQDEDFDNPLAAGRKPGGPNGASGNGHGDGSGAAPAAAAAVRPGTPGPGVPGGTPNGGTFETEIEAKSPKSPKLNLRARGRQMRADAKKVTADAKKKGLEMKEKAQLRAEELAAESMAGLKDLSKYADVAVFSSAAEADRLEQKRDEMLQAKWCGLLHPSTNTS